MTCNPNNTTADDDGHTGLGDCAAITSGREFLLPTSSLSCFETAQQTCPDSTAPGQFLHHYAHLPG